MKKIILFYKYICLASPNQIASWQKKLCTSLLLKGRIIIATEGINGTLGGDPAAIDQYVAFMRAHKLFHDVDFKEDLKVNDHFPRLRVVVKNEIVNLGIDPAVLSYKDTGTHLTPEQAHLLMQQKPDNLIILDTRNQCESAIGAFEGAIRAPIARFRDFPAYIDRHLDQFKDKKVLMYCTGGVRCERATAYLKTKNVAQEVLQIEGGIYRYIEAFPQGFFKGKNYVFDGRNAVRISEDILGNCFICAIACDDYANCLRAACNRHFICCNTCLEKFKNTCSAECLQLIQTQKAPQRPMPKKVYDGPSSSCSI